MVSANSTTLIVLLAIKTLDEAVLICKNFPSKVLSSNNLID